MIKTIVIVMLSLIGVMGFLFGLVTCTDDVAFDPSPTPTPTAPFLPTLTPTPEVATFIKNLWH